MALYELEEKCQSCGTAITIGVETANGIPYEAGTECNSCGAILIFNVCWAPDIWLDGFERYERLPTRLTVDITDDEDDDADGF